MNKKNSGLIILAVILVLAVGLFVIETQTHFARKWISSVLYDNKVEYLRCDELPSLSEVEEVMNLHQDVIQQIEAVHPGIVRVSVSSSNPACPEKGVIRIEYASHADRMAIENLIGDTFFGIPWEGFNI